VVNPRAAGCCHKWVCIRNVWIWVFIALLVMVSLGAMFAVFQAKDQHFCNTYVLIPCNVTSAIVSIGNDLQVTASYACVSSNGTSIYLSGVNVCNVHSLGCPPVIYPNSKLREYADGTVRLSCSPSDRYGTPKVVMFTFAGIIAGVLFFMTCAWFEG